MVQKLQRFGQGILAFCGAVSPWVWISVAVLVCIGLGNRAWTSYEQNQAFMERLSAIEAEIQSVEAEIISLQAEQAALRRDPKYIERLLRRNLKWKRPGDILVEPIRNE